MTEQTNLFERVLTPVQKAVLDVMRHHDGACARTFATEDIYRYSARIHELRMMGYQITKTPCKKHYHKGTLWLFKVA